MGKENRHTVLRGVVLKREKENGKREQRKGDWKPHSFMKILLRFLQSKERKDLAIQ